MTNALPPAHWAADPSGRHEHRYWDGTRWTDHVADQGRPGLDPITQEPTAVTPEPTADTPEPTDAEAAPITWPPEPTADADADIDEPSPTEPGWAAPTPAAPGAPSPSPAGSMLVPPPPPPVAGTGVVAAGRMSVYGATAWRSLSGLKTALVVLFVGMAVSSVALAATAGNRITAIDEFQRNATIDNARALNDADDAISTAAGLYAIVRIAIIVVFIVWLWRAAKNALEVLGREQPTFRPGWAIGGWFIPLANFVIPLMVVQGLWRASAPGTAPGTGWRTAKGSVLVGFWWAALLLSTVAAYSLGDDAKLEDIKDADGIVALGAIASLAAAVLAILVVVQLTRRFDERRVEELGA